MPNIIFVCAPHPTLAPQRDGGSNYAPRKKQAPVRPGNSFGRVGVEGAGATPHVRGLLKAKKGSICMRMRPGIWMRIWFGGLT